jgi:hypothetical protein
VKELIIFVIAEEIPFTIVWKVLVLVDRVLVLIIDEVAEIPLVELVSTFPDEERVFEVITEVVPIDPPIFEVKMFPDTF